MRSAQHVRPHWKNIVLAIATSLPTSALAQGVGHFTGGELYRQCTATGESVEAVSDRLACVHYLSGYIDGLLEARQLSALRTSVCVSANSYTVEYMLAFKRWAEQHPQWLSRSAPDTVAAALINAFPCQR